MWVYLCADGVSHVPLFDGVLEAFDSALLCDGVPHVLLLGGVLEAFGGALLCIFSALGMFCRVFFCEQFIQIFFIDCNILLIAYQAGRLVYTDLLIPCIMWVCGFIKIKRGVCLF